MRRLPLLAVPVLLLAACSGSSGHHRDERGWFRAYVRHITANPAARDEGIRSLGGPYVGPCVDHRSDVSWQASATHRATDPRDQMNDVLTKALPDLPQDDVDVIRASHVTSTFTDTLIIRPSAGSRLQASAPLGSSLLVVGYVEC